MVRELPPNEILSKLHIDKTKKEIVTALFDEKETDVLFDKIKEKLKDINTGILNYIRRGFTAYLKCETLKISKRRIRFLLFFLGEYKEYLFCRSKKDLIIDKAEKLYNNQINQNSFVRFSCDFKKLEEASFQF